jgi:hypothetical protein
MKNIRFSENFHIILWLLKDTCWLVQFKIGGIVMIAPTILMAFYLAWHTRKNNIQFLPNMAVCCWIIANGYWMLGEFFSYNPIPISLSFFTIGIAIISYYFIRYGRLILDE